MTINCWCILLDFADTIATIRSPREEAKQPIYSPPVQSILSCSALLAQSKTLFDLTTKRHEDELLVQRDPAFPVKHTFPGNTSRTRKCKRTHRTMASDPVWAAWYETAFEELTEGGMPTACILHTSLSSDLPRQLHIFSAEHYDQAGVARLVEVSDGGRRVKLAVSIFIAQRAENLQKYHDYDTTME